MPAWLRQYPEKCRIKRTKETISARVEIITDWRFYIMGIAEQIRQNQNIKEMTRRAIKILIAAGENVDDLKSEFFANYGEEV